MKKQIIKALHETDLDEFLKSLGFLDSLLNEQLSCSICGNTINKENLTCIYPAGSDIGFCCDKLSCYEEVLKQKKGGIFD